MARLALYACVLVAPFVSVAAYRHLAADPAAAVAGPSARPFDAADWARGDRTLRYEMASDLLSTTDFTGWSRDDVHDLLGPTADHADGFAVAAGEEYGARLGGDSGEAARAYVIVFAAGADGVVTGAAFERPGG